MSKKMLDALTMAIQVRYDFGKAHLEDCRQEQKAAEKADNVLLMGFYMGMAEMERQYLDTMSCWLKNI